jgi:hypothetical protein
MTLSYKITRIWSHLSPSNQTHQQVIQFLNRLGAWMKIRRKWERKRPPFPELRILRRPRLQNDSHSPVCSSLRQFNSGKTKRGLKRISSLLPFRCRAHHRRRKPPSSTEVTPPPRCNLPAYPIDARFGRCVSLFREEEVVALEEMSGPLDRLARPCQSSFPVSTMF